MKDVALDAEEQDILDHLDEMESVPNVKEEIARLHSYFVAHGAKKKVISLRLPEDNLLALKQKAMEEGLPYQTLIGSVLHKYVTGKLIARD